MALLTSASSQEPAGTNGRGHDVTENAPTSFFERRISSSTHKPLNRTTSRRAASALQAGVQVVNDDPPDQCYRGSRMLPSQNSAGPRTGDTPLRQSSRVMLDHGSDKLLQSPKLNAEKVSESTPRSRNEEWPERGAAVGVRRSIDVNGKQVLKSVKKGVKDFTFGRSLGEGSYSTVVAAVDRETKREYAIKVLDKRHIIKEKKVKYVNIEKDTLNRLTDHPGVVRLYYTFQDEQSLYFVLDLASSGELLGVLKRTTTFDESCTRFYSAEILDTVEYMHARGVIHRDLKPENILLDNHMHVKITDFGTAKILPLPRRQTSNGGKADHTKIPLAEAAAAAATISDAERTGSFVGTAEYVSPELLTDKKACKASDLWALGCIIYQLLVGRPPFKAANEYLTFQKIVALDYSFPTGFPPVAKDLVERLLVLDPSSRLSISHIKNHEFFDGIQWGRGMWKSKPPSLQSFVPHKEPFRHSKRIPLENLTTDGDGSPPSTSAVLASNDDAPNTRVLHNRGRESDSARNTNRDSQNAARLLTRPKTEIVLPPTQLDLEWASILTLPNERILKLGILDVRSSSTPQSPNGTAQGKESTDLTTRFSRFFSGGAGNGKKRQRLVLVTSSARVLLVAPKGGEKRVKNEISLVSSDCSWDAKSDSNGAGYWSIHLPDKFYTFQESKDVERQAQNAQSSSDDRDSSDDASTWIAILHEASNSVRDPRNTSNALNAQSDTHHDSHKDESKVDPSLDATSASSPRDDRQQELNPQQNGAHGRQSNGDVDSVPLNPARGGFFSEVNKKRFSKRQSKNVLAAVF